MDLGKIAVETQYKEMITTFCNRYEAAKVSLDSGNINSANSAYLEMAGIYSKLTASEIGEIHKKIAFRALNEVYDNIQKAGEPVIQTKNWRIMAAISLLLLIGVSAIIMKPSLVGLSVIDLQIPQIGADEKTISIFGTTTINLDTLLGYKKGSMTYLATHGSRIQTSLYENFLTLIPDHSYKGTDSLIVSASDGASIKRIPMKVRVTHEPLAG